MTPRPGQELRQRNVTPRSMPLVAPSPGPARLPPVAPAAKSSNAAHHTAPGGPPERNLAAAAAQQTFIRRPMTPGTPVPGMHPPGPPLARPVLPRERGALDRVIEYFVGDGPQNRYALICQQCLSHNGMALKEEFEYIAFRCAYCYFLNPARKTRPQAPRLPEPSAERRMIADPAASAPAAPVAEPDPTPAATEESEKAAAAECEVPESEKQESALEEPVTEEPAPEESAMEEPTTDTPQSPEPKDPQSDKSDEEHDVSAMEVE
ncbi:hypothetical protein AALO_G00042390 [Alosa alosa]|uniref:Endoplasmic reticulum junction formation protein lunapark n=1 Tax=Alosa alosa TaxID=278164 RepID=A0AAV6HDC1_9TELE|nr:hypothetical protein AALO_G00042390 [Alosa alosa]